MKVELFISCYPDRLFSKVAPAALSLEKTGLDVHFELNQPTAISEFRL
ncbi:hypothetical protein [Pedobacter zeae]|uniref:Uncharacterized protein n=1 Tax=Pedobacter zeae TaxID=1737356 RepID=A0A7W6P628_9SPHI|nr:hypothetical protein [Pedobacter zeae]MBB4108398.1 hypothetical protein [Pedobacter zeae]